VSCKQTQTNSKQQSKSYTHSKLVPVEAGPTAPAEPLRAVEEVVAGGGVQKWLAAAEVQDTMECTTTFKPKGATAISCDR
jgi:hypothetical protein